MSDFPKTLYVINEGADQATHTIVNEIDVNTDKPTKVATYRLVEEHEYEVVQVVRRTRTE